ncbi:hypothetical protein BGX29_003610 [Mortierella sp. GBA35]|nr:hypothetical protein BGX23_010641 [Mortierella sp. AD031]KAF9103264.1 hypothetical protein BGX29_003610 [Mortierella sp. GBA35]KAG0213359.1 hypothetical protein BGX33_002944 [Mortierella sp. NVP41]
MLAPVPLPFWPVASTQPRTSSGSLGLTRGAGGLVIFRPYHVTLRTLNRQPTNPLHIDDPSTTSPTSTSPPIDDDIQPQHKNPIPPNTDPKARMLIGFTCTVCNHRSHKTMSKHAYDHGVVIMQCDHCKNRHLIADHLGWFKNRGVTVEDLVKERGETVQKLTRSYQLVKDGEMAPPSSSSSSLNADAGEGAETEAGAKRVAAARGTEGSSAVKEKTELELALEKASQGMLEWIPKEILEQEEERMKKSQQSVDHTKKA